MRVLIKPIVVIIEAYHSLLLRTGFYRTFFLSMLVPFVDDNNGDNQCEFLYNRWPIARYVISSDAGKKLGKMVQHVICCIYRIPYIYLTMTVLHNIVIAFGKNMNLSLYQWPAQSKVCVFCRSLVGIASSNPAGGVGISCESCVL